MTPNSCFIFHFLPEMVAKPYTDCSGSSDTEFTIEEMLAFPVFLQKAYEESPYGKEFPYDTSRLTIRKSGDIDETFQIIEFAPREESDVTYAVKAVVRTVFDESSYYTVEESAENSNKYLLCHPEVGRHSLMCHSWDHIPTDEELIEAVSALGLDFDRLSAHIDMLKADFDQSCKSYHDFRERQKEALDKEDDDDLLIGIAEFNAFNALDMLDEEIARKQSFLQKKLQEYKGGMLTAEQGYKRRKTKCSDVKLPDSIAKEYTRVFRLGAVEPPLFVCEKYRRKGVIDLKGNEIIPCIQYEIYEQIDNDGVIPFLYDGKWGLCHFGVCSEAIFDEVIIESEEYCQVVMNGQKGWVDSDGKFTQNLEEAWFGSWHDAEK